MKETINPAMTIRGELEVPGDKSISHRAIMIGSLSNGNTTIHGFLDADDCLSTIEVYRQLGIQIDFLGGHSYIVHGNGLYGLHEPNNILHVGNSGTTIRLTAGILSGQHFHSVLTGDESIRRRPMGRIAEPLRLMGASIEGRQSGKFAPLAIRGGNLKGISYNSSIASAQVKSAVLFAGLFADEETTFKEPFKSRDHTEKMLSYFGANLEHRQNQVTIFPNAKLEGQEISVPGDISSAAFFIAAALILPNSKLVLKNIGINPTRIGFIEVLKKMNAKIELLNIRNYGLEPVADIYVEYSSLVGVPISEEWIPSLIDELPLLAVIATQAEGTTIVSGAEELRYKETDRIKTIVSELKKLGLEIQELKDGFTIIGKQNLVGGHVTSHGDHRIGMAMAIAALIARDNTVIDNTESINISYPQFFEDLRKLIKN